MSRATASSAIARAQRQARITSRLQDLTAALRALSRGDTPPAQAEAIAGRYASAIGAGRTVDPAVLSYLCSADAADADIEALDGLLLGQINPAQVAADVLARAARRGS